MKNVLSVLVLAAMVCLFVNSAAAKPPKPPADCGLDADHDGWCVEDPDRGDKLVGEKDCNDADPKVNPGANEVMDDGIDNDCVDGDLEAPANIKAWGCSSAKCVSRVLKEIEACAASTGCTVNYSSGKFVLAWSNYFIDSDCDGVRGVLDQDEKDAYDLNVKQGFHCVSERRSGGAKKAGGSGSSGSGGASKPAETKSDPKVGELEGKVGELGGRVVTLETGMTGLSGQVDGFAADLDALDEALEAETEARTKADTGLSERLDRQADVLISHGGRLNSVEESSESAQTMASSALDSAAAAHSSGVSAGLDVGVMLIGQSDIKLRNGQQARPGVAPTLLVGGHVGAETESGLYRALGAVGVPYEVSPDGNTENGFLVTLGAEVLWKLSRGSAHSVGPIVRFVQHESGGDVLGVNAMSRGGTVGVAYEFAPAWGRFRTPAHISLEGGGEQLGTKGDNFTALGNAPMALLTLTFGAGVGSPIR